MKLLIACMTIVVSMGTLWAQDDPGPRRGRRGSGFGVLVEHLGLTEQQVADLRANQQTLREASRDLIRQIGEKSRLLREEMGQESPNAAIAGQLTVEIHDLRNQMKTLLEPFTGRPEFGRLYRAWGRLDARLQLLESRDVAVHLLGVGR